MGADGDCVYVYLPFWAVYLSPISRQFPTTATVNFILTRGAKDQLYVLVVNILLVMKMVCWWELPHFDMQINILFCAVKLLMYSAFN